MKKYRATLHLGEMDRDPVPDRQARVSQTGYTTLDPYWPNKLFFCIPGAYDPVSGPL
jgi:hypothetical protein